MCWWTATQLGRGRQARDIAWAGLATDLFFVHPLYQVYNVTSGKSMPQWLSEKKKRSLRKDEEYR